ncbi:G-protein coupled receptor 35-like [Tachyglossus aculeatus]|uniref:G-protein coupled receptor 35-like n=1 Tax=Tachyglossus aculeatus TaxID=9261 RepID=UPI0018F40209|nr:G-protein coupled receptor 35-like [Tachyglossus aculeatus]
MEIPEPEDFKHKPPMANQINYSIPSDLSDEPTEPTYLGFYILIFILGVSFNFFALWIFCCKMEKWTEMRVYMINLTLADFCVLLILPFVIYSSNQKIAQTHPICLISESTYLINMLMSVWIITCIAVDRYILIKYPLKARGWKSPQKAMGICGVLWITIIGSVSSTTVLNSQNEEICFEDQTRENPYILLIGVCLGFLVPLIILTFCSIQIITSLWKKKKSDTQGENLIQKAILIVSVNWSIFIIGFLPFNTILLVKCVAALCLIEIPVSRKLLQLSVCVANANCCLDAISYYFAVKEFQAIPSFLTKSRFLEKKKIQDSEV